MKSIAIVGGVAITLATAWLVVVERQDLAAVAAGQPASVSFTFAAR
jgi:hypothetical protein